MWNTRDELSPEEQNLSNHSQESVGSTLDSFLRKPQQTYEDFVSSFTYLKLEDIEKTKAKCMTVNLIESKPASQPTCDSKSTSPTNCSYQKQDTYELEEEILDEMTCEVLEPPESGIKNCLRKKLTQFDNFLNDDGVSDEEEYNATESEYQASFDKDSSSSVGQQGMKCDKNDHMRENSPHENIMSCKSSKSDDDQTSLYESVIDSNVTPYQPDENGFLLNPGEVDNDFHKSTAAVVTNVTCLEYSTSIGLPAVDKSCVEIIKTETVIENNLSDVIPFVLDEDFDYDNVVLTPKFSAAEIEYLNSIEKFTADHL